MKLEHSFTVPVGIDDAWKILLDIERVAPCMPGATLESVDGDEFTGNVKVKLGAINLTYKGKATFVEKDEAAHRAVLDARGRDARGNGTATARVTTSMSEENGSTAVQVNTDLDITGKVAQFGRGVMVDVGNKLIGQFAECLARQIAPGDDEPVAAAAAEPATKTAPAKKSAANKTSRTRSPKATPAPSATSEEGDGGADDGGAGGGASAEATTAAHATAAVGAAGGQQVEELAQPPEPATSVNGHSAAAAQQAEQQPEQQVEPINLLEHAGPAIAKRAAPPLVGLLLVLLYVVLRRRAAR